MKNRPPLPAHAGQLPRYVLTCVGVILLNGCPDAAQSGAVQAGDVLTQVDAGPPDAASVDTPSPSGGPTPPPPRCDPSLGPPELTHLASAPAIGRAPYHRFHKAGDLAVGTSMLGLDVLDVSDPLNIRPLGFLDDDGYVFGTVRIDGHVAWVHHAPNRVRAVDLTDPAAPSLISATPGGAGWILDAEDGLVFVANTDFDGLTIVDGTTPAQPLLAATISTAGVVMGADASGPLLAYVHFTSDLVTFVDVSTPETPETVGFIDVAGECWLRDVKLEGSYAFVSCNGLRVYDIADPAAPVHVATLDLAEDGELLTGDGVVLFVPNNGEGVTIDVSDPLDPRLGGELAVPSGDKDHTVDDGFIYLTGDGAGVRVVDASNLEALEEVATFDHSGDGSQIVVRGDQVWVADGNAGLRMYDVQEPSAPRQMLHWNEAPVTDVHVTDTVAYVAAGSLGLVVLDITQPSAPVELGRLESGTSGLESASGYLLTSGDHWLDVVDVSDPTAPMVVLSHSTKGFSGREVTVVGDHAFVATSIDLFIHDLSDLPETPQVGWLGLSSLGQPFLAHGWAFLPSLYALSVFDVSDPSEVRSVLYGLELPVTNVALDYPWLLGVSRHTDGIVMLDVSTPAMPGEVVTWPHTPAETIVVDGEHAYLSGWRSPLEVVRVDCPRP